MGTLCKVRLLQIQHSKLPFFYELKSFRSLSTIIQGARKNVLFCSNYSQFALSSICGMEGGSVEHTPPLLWFFESASYRPYLRKTLSRCTSRYEFWFSVPSIKCKEDFSYQLTAFITISAGCCASQAIRSLPSERSIMNSTCLYNRSLWL